MRRETLVKELVAIEAALKQSGAGKIFSFLARSSGERDAKPPEFLADSLNGDASFMISYQNFGPEEKEILKEFYLDALVQAETWVSSLKPTPDSPQLNLRVRFVLETFPKFANILRRDIEKMDLVVPFADQKAEQILPTKRMTFLIRELDKPTLTLKDFGSIIGDIESLFQAILKIDGASTSDLVVVALDSGSEKSIDVVGIAAAVDKLSTFLLEVWDRVRFARSSKLRASIKTTSEGIALLNELKACQEKGSLSAEEAEKLKRVLLKGVDDLFVKGVYTREMQESVPIQPSQLEFQRTKLLANYSGKTTSIDGRQPDEQAQDDTGEDDLE